MIDPPPLSVRIVAALSKARETLLAGRTPDGYWAGELSSSALSTATAVCALAIVQRNTTAGIPPTAPLIERGLRWLAAHANADGGWGDTVRSVSNISTTALVWAAFGAVHKADDEFRQTVENAKSWLAQKAGGTGPGTLAPAVIRRYGKDRTFSVPILTQCALAGRLGSGREAWRWVLPLPFELAACPRGWFAALRLPVVSYALPALIAIGQARHHHRPSRNPLARVFRNWTRARTLNVLAEIQPSSGGFLEATPLTSFVVMSLAGSGQVNHRVTQKGLEFLVASVRPDGSWPIDTNLATWVTTLAVNAVALRAEPRDLRSKGFDRIREWLLRQQFHQEHPYTRAAPGGWAWTDLPGGVPDADDTAGALLALNSLDAPGEAAHNAIIAGTRWLLNLQNRDGGIPTFCRGWGALPFDRSAPDLTAHAVRAWLAWRDEVSLAMQRRIDRAISKALAYLARTQRADGTWVPLWFGNQFAPDGENPVYGTSRVLVALQELSASGFDEANALREKAVNWLLSIQKPDGSWGGCAASPSSVEETALAVEALASAYGDKSPKDPSRFKSRNLSPALRLKNALLNGAVDRFGSERGNGRDRDERLSAGIETGARWLVEQVESGSWQSAAPIGFYFAKLWYYERLYPLIFTTGALGRLMGIAQ